MGSAFNIVVGFILLFCAFIVGKHVHNQPADQQVSKLLTTKIDESVQTQPQIQPQSIFAPRSSGLSASTANKPDSLQKSLRQQILGSRGITPPNNSLPKLNPQSVFKPGFENSDFIAAQRRAPNSATTSAPELLSTSSEPFSDEIVEPDFTELDFIDEPEPISIPVRKPPTFEREPVPFAMQPPLNAPISSLPSQTRTSEYDRSMNFDRTRDLAWQGEFARPRKNNLPSRSQWTPPVRLRPEPVESISVRPPTGQRRNRIADSRQSYAPRKLDPPKPDPNRLAPKLSTNAGLSRVSSRDQHLPLEAADFLNYTCKRGDTLHGISQKYYGTSKYYLDIYVHNREVMQNPTDITSGKRLKIPVYSN